MNDMHSLPTAVLQRTRRPSPEERLYMYSRTRCYLMQSPPWRTICHAMQASTGYRPQLIGHDERWILPELWNIGNSRGLITRMYWFPVGSLGVEQRIAVLQQCIDEVKLIINSQKSIQMKEIIANLRDAIVDLDRYNPDDVEKAKHKIRTSIVELEKMPEDITETYVKDRVETH